MKKSQSSRFRLFLLSIVFYILAVMGYAFWRTYEAKKELMAEIDAKLTLAAKSLKYMLAPDFHDRALDADSISHDEEMKNRAAITGFADETDFIYLQTIVEKDGKFYFSAPTVTPEEAVERESWYFYPYDDIPPEFVQAYKERKPVFVTYTDQWGTFRSIGLPQVSPGGRVYLSSADYEVSYLQGLLFRKYAESALTAAAFLLFTLPFFLVYRRINADLRVVNTELTEHKEHLEQLVESRTAQLREAMEAAEEANRMKSRFVFNVSHELRTPMNGIIGFCEAIRDTNAIHAAHEYARVILRESEVMMSLINDLLDRAKIEAGKMTLEDLPFDLAQLMEEISSSAGMLARSKGLELNIVFRGDTPQYVRGDALRLRQILMNLISNAVKFTDEGSVLVEVAKAGTGGAKSRLRFSVTDTGIGIQKERQKAIFQSFTQADASTTRKYGGTGLGTTIAYELVRLMGGEMGLESELGKGSTFWFEVALGEAMASEITVKPNWRHAAFPHKARRAGHILLAEDQPTNQAVAHLFLENAGHAVTIVSNGEEAVKACRRESFDLILMDLQMPVMDGHEAARKIREEGTSNSTVPILALTASAEIDTREACVDEGMDDVITKPIRRDSFLSTVEHWLPSSVTEIAMPAVSEESEDEEDVFNAPVNVETAERELGSRDAFHHVLSFFLNETRKDIDSMSETLTQQNMEALRHQAHCLKGSSSTVRAEPLAALARRLERAVESGQEHDVAPILEAIRAEFQRLESYAQTHGLLSQEQDE